MCLTRVVIRMTHAHESGRVHITLTKTLEPAPQPSGLPETFQQQNNLMKQGNGSKMKPCTSAASVAFRIWAKKRDELRADTRGWYD
jgi:hypothetical protein